MKLRVVFVALLGCVLLHCAKPTATTPKGEDDFLIFINYELGMHCTGFDFEYCCGRLHQVSGA